MDIPRETDDYIKEMITDSLGLPVSNNFLQLKLRASLNTYRRLRDQTSSLLDKLKEKDEVIGRVKVEGSMDAVKLKNFVKENQKLTEERRDLVRQCNEWQRERELYDHAKEVIMEFWNEADESAKEAEIRVGKLENELKFYKHEKENYRVETFAASTDTEDNLLDFLLGTAVTKDEAASGMAFLEANSSNDSCQKLLKLWTSLRPSTRKALSLAAKVSAFQNDKEHLKVNLSKAEEEVKLLYEENNILAKENNILLQSLRRKRSRLDDASDGKHTGSSSAKRSKRKSSPTVSIPLERKTLNSEEMDSMGLPLSPRNNSS